MAHWARIYDELHPPTDASVLSFSLLVVAWHACFNHVLSPLFSARRRSHVEFVSIKLGNVLMRGNRSFVASKPARISAATFNLKKRLKRPWSRNADKWMTSWWRAFFWKDRRSPLLSSLRVIGSCVWLDLWKEFVDFSVLNLFFFPVRCSKQMWRRQGMKTLLFTIRCRDKRLIFDLGMLQCTSYYA